MGTAQDIVDVDPGSLNPETVESTPPIDGPVTPIDGPVTDTADVLSTNPIVTTDQIAGPGQFIFLETGDEYQGYYHIHDNGTLMIGPGQQGISHEISPDEVIIPVPQPDMVDEPVEIIVDSNVVSLIDSIDDATTVPLTKQLIKELVHDKIVKLFGKMDIDPQMLLQNQKTIRGGNIVTSRSQDDLLVLYQRDGDIYTDDEDETNKINMLVDTIYVSLPGTDEASPTVVMGEINQVTNMFQLNKTETDNDLIYKLQTNLQGFNAPSLITVGHIKSDGTIINALNIGQLIYTNTNIQYDINKARSVLDTTIDELLPAAGARQQLIDDFFRLWAELRPPQYPNYLDTDEDGFTDFITFNDFETFSQNNISNSSNPNNKFITWLQEQEDITNTNKSLEWLYKDLQNYFAESLSDTDAIEDPRPLYIPKSSGYLKLRALNQSILIRKQEGTDIGLIGNDPNNPKYLTNGMTISIWVRFLNKDQTGTLMNFGNPYGAIGSKGFALETIILKSEDLVDVNSNIHPDVSEVLELSNTQTTFGQLTAALAAASTTGYEDVFENTDTIRFLRLSIINDTNQYIDNSIPVLISGTNTAPKSIPKYSNIGPIPQIGNERGIEILTYTQIPINFDEWFFINASYDPTVTQSQNDANLFGTEYWNNQYNPTTQTFVEFSGVGNQCVVEYISKSDLIRARGFRVE